jgi:electron transport complex protein RnfG
VSPVRLVGTLAVSGALAGALLVVVFQITLPAITANRERQLRAAVEEVLQQPARFETLWVVDGRLESEAPEGGDAERVYLGWRADGAPAGFAVTSGAPGYADTVGLMFGYDPGPRRLLGMTVLESKETPGLGDRIERPEFRGQFAGRELPLQGVKAGTGTGDAREVDVVSGATISSRAAIRAINEGLERVGPALEAWAPPATVGESP